jgi:ABC-type uncharacterized transport system, ATPase component
VLVIDHGKIFFDGPLAGIVDRFSGYKILSLTFETEGTRDLSAFGEIIEQTPVSVQLKVPRAKVTETCRQLLEACDVSDINVQEVPVEDVIRQLFGETHEGSSWIRCAGRGSCTCQLATRTACHSERSEAATQRTKSARPGFQSQIISLDATVCPSSRDV